MTSTDTAAKKAFSTCLRNPKLALLVVTDVLALVLVVLSIQQILIYGGLGEKIAEVQTIYQQTGQVDPLSPQAGALIGLQGQFASLMTQVMELFFLLIATILVILFINNTWRWLWTGKVLGVLTSSKKFLARHTVIFLAVALIALLVSFVLVSFVEGNSLLALFLALVLFAYLFFTGKSFTKPVKEAASDLKDDWKQVIKAYLAGIVVIALPLLLILQHEVMFWRILLSITWVIVASVWFRVLMIETV